MKSSLHNIIFYVIIAGDDQTDHVFLRKAMNKLVPQAIVESLYEPGETITFLQKHSPVPHLIFLDQNMIARGGSRMLQLIRDTEEFKHVPVIILTEDKLHFTKNDLVRYGADEFYPKPYHAKTLDQIVSDLRERWFSSMFNQRNSA